MRTTIGGKFIPLIGLKDEDMDINTMITTYNTEVTDAAGEILGNERRRKKSPEMFSTSVMREEIRRRRRMKQEEQKNTRKRARGYRTVYWGYVQGQSFTRTCD